MWNKLLVLLLISSPVAYDAIDLVSDIPSFSLWTPATFREAHSSIQEIANFYLNAGYTGWSTYGNINETPFKWQLVPYQGDTPQLFNQIQILWNTTFPPSNPGYQVQIPQFPPGKNVERSAPNDPFIDPAVLQKQRIYAGKLIDVLYNYAPLGEHHFLLIPKREALSFLNLSVEEYVEAEEIAQSILSYYPHLQGHLLDKNGKSAGQTVPHWHQHLILTEPGANDWLTRLQFAFRMLFGAHPLPEEELKTRVESYRENLGYWISRQFNF